MLNKYLIFHFIGAAENGKFALIHKIGTGIFFIGLFLYLSTQDQWLSDKNFKQKQVYFYSLLKKIALVTSLSVIAITATCYFAFPRWFPMLTDVSRYIPLFGLIIVCNVLSNYTGLLYNYNKDSFTLAKTTFIGAVISMLFSFLLITYIGLWGVLAGILIGSVTILINRLMYAAKFFENLPNPKQ